MLLQPQNIERPALVPYKGTVLTKYGDRFRELRERAGLSQGQVADELKLKKGRGSSISNIELKQTYAPARASTVKRHAKALKAEPWELLIEVPTPIDRLRQKEPWSDEDLSVWLWAATCLSSGQRRAHVAPLETLRKKDVRLREGTEQTRSHDPETQQRATRKRREAR